MACGGSVEQIEEHLPPEKVSLIFPEDNTECNEGTIINEFQSSVLFQWDDAPNADMYEVVIEDLEDQSKITRETANTEIEITVGRGKPYQWYVVSKSNTIIETATSETWKFYNAGDGKASHAPFPADIVYPNVGDTVSGSTSVTLEWSSSDIDNDVVGYEVYFGVENPPVNNIGTINSNSFNVNVTSGNIYYWSVKTMDKTNNVSNSEVFWFKTD